MASELKPCPFCGGEAKHMVWGGGGLVASVPHSKVCCTECRMTTGPVQKHEDGDRAIERWNTRPAPAATDTGLETVAFQHRRIDKYGVVGDWRPYKRDLFGSDRIESRELVTRSQAEELLAGRDVVIETQANSIDKLERKVRHWQERDKKAEELLAAERAKTERWHKKAMDAGVIVHSDGTTSHPMRKERDDLKADNAAKDAQLERFRCDRAYTVGFTDGHDAAEAKLAAQAARIKELEEALDSDPSGSDLWRYWSRKAREASQKYVDEVDRAEALEAKLAAAEKINDAMRKAAVDYCWQRYKGRDPLNLKIPAVFTSHEWEKIGETMDAAARAVLGSKP